jgi:two-component system sensor histidine kinase PhoQ
LPEQLPDPRFASLGSGLFAEITDDRGRRLWRSPSATGVDLASPQSVGIGQRRFDRRRLAGDIEVLVLGIGIRWEFMDDQYGDFQVFVAEDMARYGRQLTEFRQGLLSWFAGVMLTLVVALGALLRWGLVPLRRMADEIVAIEGGEIDQLSENYPRELSGVARNMNAMVKSERQRMARFSTTMDDLAHSLKTPLAVVRSELEGRQPDAGVLRDQVARMQSVIDYQLRRAAAKGPRTLARNPVAIAPICHDILSSLRRIHRDKNVQCDLDIPTGASYPAEQGDLYELIGNLMDNAWKWCRSHVTITARVAPAAGDTPGEFALVIADDGSGISVAQLETLFQRGERGDGGRADVPGHGIGLAVVAEIVGLYGGAISVDESRDGGAEFTVRLPM